MQNLKPNFRVMFPPFLGIGTGLLFENCLFKICNFFFLTGYGIIKKKYFVSKEMNNIQKPICDVGEGCCCGV